MKTLLVQDYLRSGKTLADLSQDHGVYSTITNGKIALSYDMIEAKESDQLACQCRGLVLEEHTYNIIAVPFFRFFNSSQENLIPKDFNWDKAKYLEKSDGSLTILYFFKDKWNVGTRSRSEADGNIDGSELTFAKLFDMAVQHMWVSQQLLFANNESLNHNIQTFMNLFGEKAKGYTFCFELTSPYNRIVCKYEDIKLTLLMVKNNTTFQEEDPKTWMNSMISSIYGLKTATEYDFNDFNHMVEVVNSWKPEDHEGVVVIDDRFNRIKVKNIAYCLYNRMRDSLSTSVRGCVEAILLGKDDDLIGMMPAMISNRLVKLKPLIQSVYSTVESDFESIKDVENMKEFAGYAEFKLWPAAMYALKRKKVPNFHEFLVGNQVNGKIPTGVLDSVLSMCEKIDPTIKNL